MEALDISGYNNVFRNFAEFAQRCYDADNGTKAGRLKAASLVPDAYRFDGRVEVKVTAHLDKA